MGLVSTHMTSSNDMSDQTLVIVDDDTSPNSPTQRIVRSRKSQTRILDSNRETLLGEEILPTRFTKVKLPKEALEIVLHSLLQTYAADIQPRIPVAASNIGDLEEPDNSKRPHTASYYNGSQGSFLQSLAAAVDPEDELDVRVASSLFDHLQRLSFAAGTVGGLSTGDPGSQAAELMWKLFQLIYQVSH